MTLDAKNEDRFDWQVSVEPQDLKKMVSLIKDYKPAFGHPLRSVSSDEKHFRKLVYKKLVLNKNKKMNEILCEEDFEIKRSNTGFESSLLSELIGRRINRDLKTGTAILHSDLI